MKTKNESNNDEVIVNKINKFRICGKSQNANSNLNSKNSKIKAKSTNKCDLGADFIAPDGHWGWIIVIAAGCSNVCFSLQMYLLYNYIFLVLAIKQLIIMSLFCSHSMNRMIHLI